MIEATRQARRGPWRCCAAPFPTIVDGARGLWQSDSRTQAWLVPLLVFLCLTGLLLVVAASVEALAPFVYAIF